jgi:hypothetical protein
MSSDVPRSIYALRTAVLLCIARRKNMNADCEIIEGMVELNSDRAIMNSLKERAQRQNSWWRAMFRSNE